MANPATGPAALTIDTCYKAKLAICQGWDWTFGLHESHPFSAVFVLEVCYAIRRPFFVATDEVFLVMSPSSKGKRAIRNVSVSPFGGHKVIEAEFSR